MQHPGNSLYMATSAPLSVAPSVAGSAYAPANSVIHAQPTNNVLYAHSTMRHPLPNRNIDINSIEDAYVSFILACNPGVPSSVETTALREAFWTVPRSDGKSFSIYIIYLLIRELEDRIIKTWIELALKLGVEPPDQDKGQSSQKIHQYTARLKRWMHSMHVDAFFDYLMGRSHPYCTETPPANYPISELLRDGVAAKDDMALRALVPGIKPRRSCKHSNESDSNYIRSRDPQRQCLDNYTDNWTGTQNAGRMFSYPSSQQQLYPDGTMRASPPWRTGADGMNNSMSHGGFYEDSQPPVGVSSANSGHRPGRRHGAKVVSSAWRSNGTRGRPLVNRASNHHALPHTHHTHMHMGEKPFKCLSPGCGKSFAWRGSLTDHTYTHTGKKPFKCDSPGCGKSFIRRGYLTEHTRTHQCQLLQRRIHSFEFDNYTTESGNDESPFIWKSTLLHHGYHYLSADYSGSTFPHAMSQSVMSPQDQKQPAPVQKLLPPLMASLQPEANGKIMPPPPLPGRSSSFSLSLSFSDAHILPSHFKVQDTRQNQQLTMPLISTMVPPMESEPYSPGKTSGRNSFDYGTGMTNWMSADASPNSSEWETFMGFEFETRYDLDLAQKTSKV